MADFSERNPPGQNAVNELGIGYAVPPVNVSDRENYFGESCARRCTRELTDACVAEWKPKQAPPEQLEQYADMIIGMGTSGRLAFIERMSQLLKKYSVPLPTINVQYDVDVEADALIGSASLPTLSNTVLQQLKGMLCLDRGSSKKLHILRNVRGALRPGRMTLLLGPPGAGKSTLLKALAGRLQANRFLRVKADVKYNGHELHEFVPSRTAAFVDQLDCHIGILSVHETLRFSYRCQNGNHEQQFSPAAELIKAKSNVQSIQVKSASTPDLVGDKAAQDVPVHNSEGSKGVSMPTKAHAGNNGADVDQSGTSFGIGTDTHAADADTGALGVRNTLERLTSEAIESEALTDEAFEGMLRKVWGSGVKTEVIMRLMGLWECRDTWVGGEAMRGISGGQRKRLTTAEMLVGPKTLLLMDEISTGLDSATLFSIMCYIRSVTEAMQLTALVSLLQPPPETVALFHDIIVLTDGRVLYHGPMLEVLTHFEALGFKCPLRKDTASFLQEITTPVGQRLYATAVHDAAKQQTPTEQLLLSLEDMEKAFWENSVQGQAMQRLLDSPFPKEQSHEKALVKTPYALSWMPATLHVLARQGLLVLRDKILLRGRIIQVCVIGLIIGSLYWNIPAEISSARLFLGCMFMTLMFISMGNMPQLAITMMLKPVWYKQRDNNFFHGSSYSMAMTLSQAPVTLLECILFGTTVYFMCNFTRTAACYFKFQLILLLAGLCFGALFRFIASVSSSLVRANGIGGLFLFMLIVTSGFAIVPSSIPSYWIWVYWMSPMAYAFRAMVNNEFQSERWSAPANPNNPNSPSMGQAVIDSFGMKSGEEWVWIGVGYLIGITLLLVLAASYALQWIKALQPRAVVPDEKVLQAQKEEARKRTERLHELHAGDVEKGKSSAMDFQPVTLAYNNLRYFVPNPSYKQKDAGEQPKELELLKGITGIIRPGQLTALMGGSGAGKTTFMDVIAMRKTVGRIEGNIYVNGHPQDKRSWRRVMGYAEQDDIHSAQTTVLEALQFSARLRLPRGTDKDKMLAHVDEVLAMVDLAEVSQNLVGFPGQAEGLSVDQRKRLTIAVEMVANPSVLFCDEPTSGLDARAAATVIRAVRNICDKGRTVVVTVHQPSIDIFETFDYLLLLHKGGRVVYFGSLGHQSSDLVAYLEAVPGVTALPPGYNPSTWMLEVTGGAMSTLTVAANQDFPALYKDSELARSVAADVERAIEEDGKLHQPLTIHDKFAAPFWAQVVELRNKYMRIYWRSPAYNLMRMTLTLVIALLVGSLYWNKGQIKSAPAKTGNVQNVLGVLYVSTMFIGNINMMSAQPVLSFERVVHYRERAVSMYSTAAYNLGAQSVELPYLIAQTTLFVPVAYFMIGFQHDVQSFFYYYIMFFLSLSMYTFFGAMLVYATPSQALAQVIGAGLNFLMNFFNGFSIAYSVIPAGWKWMNRIVPPTWIIYGLAASQLGDNDTPMVLADGSKTTVSGYLEDYFGYHYDFRWYCILIVAGYVIAFRVLGTLALTYINYERR